MAMLAGIVTFIIILALLSVIPVVVWLIYKLLYDRHANAMLSGEKKGRKWMPPFVAALIAVAAEIFFIVGLIAMFRVNTNTGPVVTTSEAPVVRVNFVGYDTCYEFYPTGEMTAADLDEITICYKDKENYFYDAELTVQVEPSDAFNGNSGLDGYVTVDIENIDPAYVYSVTVRGMEDGNYQGGYLMMICNEENAPETAAEEPS